MAQQTTTQSMTLQYEFTPKTPYSTDSGSSKLDRPNSVDFSTHQQEQSGDTLDLLLGLFRLIWLFGKGQHAVCARKSRPSAADCRLQPKAKAARLVRRNRWFCIALSLAWKDWRQALCIVHPDSAVRWQRGRFRRYWAQPVAAEVCNTRTTAGQP
jgi:hypothetical protein